MFQYSFGRALAEAQGLELVLDTSSLAETKRAVTPRSYALGAFRPRASVYKGAPIFSSRRISTLRRLPWLAYRSGLYIENGHNYDATAMFDKQKYYWAGYWQSPLYFNAIADTLFEDFKPIRPPSTATIQFIGALDPTKSVMLHVRRGDYVKHSAAQAHHGVTALDYYRAAVAQTMEKVSHLKVYVFSDDIEWCRQVEVASPAKDIVYVAPDRARHDWEDLWMMSHCSHQIIANSSFSWWSAWLADRRFGLKNRQIYAPYRWFRAAEIRKGDRFPNHWNVV